MEIPSLSDIYTKTGGKNFIDGDGKPVPMYINFLSIDINIINEYKIPVSVDENSIFFNVNILKKYEIISFMDEKFILLYKISVLMDENFIAGNIETFSEVLINVIEYDRPGTVVDGPGSAHKGINMFIKCFLALLIMF